MKYDNVLDSTSQYGPQGLLGRDRLISTGYWANTQANILTGTGLPVSNEEMKTYLNLPDNVEIPQDFQKLYDVYNEYKQMCDWWLENLFSCVNNMANDIYYVGTFTLEVINERLQPSLRAITTASNDQDKQDAIENFQTVCLALMNKLNDNQQSMEQVQNLLNSFLQGDSNCIGVTQLNNSFEEVMTYLDSQYNDESEIHNLLNMFMHFKKLLGEILEEIEINEKVKFSSELGPLIGFIVSEMLEYSEVQMIKQQIDHFQNLIGTDAQFAFVKVLSLFHSVNIDLHNAINQAEMSMEFIKQTEGNWRFIANKFGSLPLGFENEDINKLSTDLDNAAATWEAVANKAKEFVTNSYQG
ncbi:toxin [Bacillus velezensis]|uniref:toxin n=1 Tax=Bacillus velezensis TaxID=492670 RepID=UPI00285BF104|nr:toxin [Bacillus velezensis]MDR7906866.1 toxin [Bacillus velezensis]